MKCKVHVWIEIDVDYHRTGLDFSQFEPIKALALEILKCKNIALEGIYVHSGNSYDGRSKKSAQATFDRSAKAMNSLKMKLRGIRGFEKCKISYGDTPTCS